MPWRVAVLAPSGRDAALLSEALARAGVPVQVVRHLHALCAEIDAGMDVGIVAEEAITWPEARLLIERLSALPSWSEPPLIILGGPSRNASVLFFERLSPVANLTLLERPTQPFALVTAVKAAIRSRDRQNATRQHLAELEAARTELAHRQGELSAAIDARTAELEAAHQALRLSERMAAIGTLAAGVGHDIANLLLPVRVQVEALEASGESDSQSLKTIRACAEHLQRLAAGLRLLALDPGVRPAVAEPTDIGAWWIITRPVLQAAVPSSVKIESSIESGIVARIEPHQLSQAVFNLVQNAGDALRARESGGHIRLTAKVADNGSDVVVSVADDGPGMPPDVLRRCLEPLFTTKTRQIGTGLGLVLVQGIVRRAEGVLTVRSEVGVGTTFSMTLPRATMSPSPVRLRAALSIAEPRLFAVVKTTLGGLGVETVGQSPDDHTGLWVAEGAALPPQRAREFLNADRSRRLLVFGPVHGLDGEPRVVQAAAKPSAEQLRTVLSAACGR